MKLYDLELSGNSYRIRLRPAIGAQGAGLLEQRLAAHQWLAVDHVTIADIACFPYVALASEGEMRLDPYVSVRSWVERIKALPDFVGMPGI